MQAAEERREDEERETAGAAEGRGGGGEAALFGAVPPAYGGGGEGGAEDGVDGDEVVVVREGRGKVDEAEDGDVLKSKTSFAMLSRGANGSREWKGNLKYLKPGEGYMLYRTREGEVQFTYPFLEANATFFEQSNQAPKMWDDYMSNMVMTATADGIELHEGDKLIAYSGAEIRGESIVSSDDHDGIFYITIAGNEKAPLSFAIEREGDIIATTSEVMTFQANFVAGKSAMPTRINFMQRDIPQYGWYTLDGIRLQGKPVKKGVYIYNGKKRVVE